MKIEDVHKILLVAFREGINKVTTAEYYNDLVKVMFDRSKNWHDTTVLLGSKYASDEFLENYDPGGEPDAEDKVMLQCLYHLFALKGWATRMKKIIELRKNDPIEYGRQMAFAQIFG